MGSAVTTLCSFVALADRNLRTGLRGTVATTYFQLLQIQANCNSSTHTHTHTYICINKLHTVLQFDALLGFAYDTDLAQKL